MKLHLLDRTSSGHHSFNIVWHRFPNFLKIWHHHPELELVVVRKSKGTLFLGDSIEKFEEGEVVLIGKDLPHMWKTRLADAGGACRIFRKIQAPHLGQTQERNSVARWPLRHGLRIALMVDRLLHKGHHLNLDVYDTVDGSVVSIPI